MIDDVLTETSQKMDQTVESVRKELASIRTGRASLSLLDGISVAAYGSEMPLNQVATLALPEPALITVKPFDGGLLGDIERAILKADLGINPNNDGKIIRLPIPPLTDERRQQLTRKVNEIAEKGRTGVRNVRRDANDLLKALEKDGEAPADDVHRALDDVQALTDKHVESIDRLAKGKSGEILED